MSSLVSPSIADLVRSLSARSSKERENAASALANLSYLHPENKGLIAQCEGAIPGLVSLLSPDKTPKQRKYAASALANLALLSPQHRLLSGPQSREIFRLYRSPLHDKFQRERREDVATALWYFASNCPKHGGLIDQQAGAIAGLMSLLSADITAESAAEIILDLPDPALKRIILNKILFRRPEDKGSLINQLFWQTNLLGRLKEAEVLNRLNLAYKALSETKSMSEKEFFGEAFLSPETFAAKYIEPALRASLLEREEVNCGAGTGSRIVVSSSSLGKPAATASKTVSYKGAFVLGGGPQGWQKGRVDGEDLGL